MEETNAKVKHEKFTLTQILRCVVFSLIGGGAFLCPLPQEDGSLVIPISLIIGWVNEKCADWIIYTAVAVVIISAIGAILGSVFKLPFLQKYEILRDTFCVKWYWVVARCLGAIFVIMIFWQIGPEALIGPDTGSFVLYDLIGTILSISIIAGAFLPLMTEFGLMEFVGTIVGPIFKKVFKIPGRAAVDCLSSWLGDTSVAVVLTNGQMEKGYYTQREAATIATTFSAVSITFALTVIAQVGFIDYFFPFYGIVALVGVVCAIIMPRIAPLSRIPDTYIVESKYEGEVYSAPGYNLIQWAWHQALTKANNNGYTVKSYLYDWAKNCVTLLFILPPIIVFIGTTMLMIAYNTPILEWLGYPFMPLLQLLQIPEASAASQTMVAGFADMFIPAILASGTIGSAYTRFLVAVISITQLIFISENGSMILSTRIPVNIGHLFVIFLERTIISLIVASLAIRLFLPELLLM